MGILFYAAINQNHSNKTLNLSLYTLKRERFSNPGKQKMSENSNTLPDNIDWDALLDDLRDQKLVPFLGAGASLGQNERSGLPTGSDLSKSLAKRCHYPGKDSHDLLRVAQFFALKRGEMRLRECVRELLSLPNVQPGEVHQILAGWPVKVVFTTNYDNLMERAFVMKGKDPSKVIYNRFGDQEQINSDPAIHTPLVYKLHGSLENIDTMVITEDNYIDFLISLIEGNPKIPDTISRCFLANSILFIGYGLKDWNIRVLLRYFRKNDIRWYSVQRDLKTAADEDAAREWESTVLYWEHKKISLYNCDALAFLKELNRCYQEVGSDA